MDRMGPRAPSPTVAKSHAPRRRAVAVAVAFAGASALAVTVAACAGPGPRAAPARVPPVTSAVPSSPFRTLVVVSIDGLRHDYLDDREHEIPTLRRLRAEGARARTVHGVWPTVTYPAHTTLVTGATPARHGIVSNVVFDPFEHNDGGWYWYTVDVRVPTLWDVAADAGIEVANATWPVTVGARIRYNLPQFWRAKNPEDEKLLSQLGTPGLYAEVAKVAPPPGEHRKDRARADAALYLIREKRPGLVFVYLAELDNVQHEHGPMSPEAWAELERIDLLVGEIVGAASAVAPRLAVAIVSDHGFVSVDTDVRPNVALRREGLLEAYTRSKDGITEDVLRSYEAVTWKAGGSAAIMGRRGRAEPTASRVKALFTRLAADPTSRLGAVIDGERVERGGGFPGAIVVLQAAKGATFSERFDEPLVAPSHYKGMHGYSPDLPEMGASFVLWGDGVRAGDLGEVAMIDVAPTLATLIGLSLPAADGKPIRQALAR
jgi:predicted AlkP superfamily pyrophosphatase or phosphodiesterase